MAGGTLSRTLTAPSAALADSTSAMWTVESVNSVFSDEALVALSSDDLQVPVSSLSSPEPDYSSIDALPSLYEDSASAFAAFAKRKLSAMTTDAAPSPPFYALSTIPSLPGVSADDVVLNTFSQGLFDFGSVMVMNGAESTASTPAASATNSPAPSRAASPTRKQRSGSVPTSRAALATSTADDAADKYLRRRRNNNESACRSRAKRRQLEKENADRVAELQRANAELLVKTEKLENEAKYLRALLLTLAKNAAMPAASIDALLKGDAAAATKTEAPADV